MTHPGSLDTTEQWRRRRFCLPRVTGEALEPAVRKGHYQVKMPVLQGAVRGQRRFKIVKRIVGILPPSSWLTLPGNLVLEADLGSERRKDDQHSGKPFRASAPASCVPAPVRSQIPGTWVAEATRQPGTHASSFMQGFRARGRQHSQGPPPPFLRATKNQRKRREDRPARTGAPSPLVSSHAHSPPRTSANARA